MGKATQIGPRLIACVSCATAPILPMTRDGRADDGRLRLLEPNGVDSTASKQPPNSAAPARPLPAGQAPGAAIAQTGVLKRPVGRPPARFALHIGCAAAFLRLALQGFPTLLQDPVPDPPSWAARLVVAERQSNARTLVIVQPACLALRPQQPTAVPMSPAARPGRPAAAGND